MAYKAKILIVDDEASITAVLKALLKREGYQTRVCSNGDDALLLLQKTKFDIMLSDICMSPMDGLELLQKAKKLNPHLTVIIMTAYAGVDTAMSAVELGAYDYVCKPFKVDELLAIIQNALTTKQDTIKDLTPTVANEAAVHFGMMVGNSPQITEIYDTIRKLAGSDDSILIEGESGTGKELVAKALHNLSTRSSHQFVAINCGAMPESLLESELFGHVRGAFTGANKAKRGLFEIANGGTLFLDEIGTIPLNMQTTLLRVLQEHEIRPVGGTQNIPVDVRIIAASNENLEDKISRGELREDLYYRIGVIPIHLPPLRERTGDIELLIHHFVALHNKQKGSSISFSADAIHALQNYHWAGNIRELKNIIQRSIALSNSKVINLKNLPQKIREQTAIVDNTKNEEELEFAEFAGSTLKSYLKTKERDYIRYVLKKVNGSKEQAAEILGISLATFYRKYNDI